MKCTHYACTAVNGGQRRYRLPGLDTTCYATGDTVTAGGKHFLLGNAHREHYGNGDQALDVSWDVTEVQTPAPHLTRARD